MARADQLDLSALERRDEPPQRARPPRRTPIGLFVAIALLAGLWFVFGDAIQQGLATPQPVSIIRPRAVMTAAANAAASFRGAGWIEPEPWPVLASALVPGVVREVLVREGAQVALGQPLAQLHDERARAARDTQAAHLREARARAARTAAERDMAALEFERGLEVREAAALAQAEVDEVSARDAELQALAAGAQARAEASAIELRMALELERQAAAGPFEVAIARARHAAAVAEADGQAAAVLQSAARRRAADARLARAEAELQGRLAERRALERLKADAALAALEVQRSEQALALAEWELAACLVLAPVEGVVLSIGASPGTALDEAHTRTIARIYRPETLRARVDVPLAALPGLSAGRSAIVRSEALADATLTGRVLRFAESADVQKGTLAMHVSVQDELRRLRPDMLVQVEVLREAAGPEAALEALEIPRRCIVQDRYVFVLSADGRTAERREITVLSASGDSALVQAGIDLSAKVIDRGLSGLKGGERVLVETTP